VNGPLLYAAVFVFRVIFNHYIWESKIRAVKYGIKRIGLIEYFWSGLRYGIILELN